MKIKSSYLVKVLSLTAVLVFIASLVIQAEEDKSNFSGIWALNFMESSPAARGEISELIVKQEGNFLTTTTTHPDGTSFVSKYTLDGKESVNMEGLTETRSTAMFSGDGKKLTILKSSYGADEEKTDQDVWRMTDAKTLSIVCTTMGSSGDEVVRYVFTRK